MYFNKKLVLSALLALAVPASASLAQCVNSYTLDQTTSNANLEISDRFGDALAVGDFNGDNLDDLVVGSPWEDIGAIFNSGQVFVHFGTVNGLGNTSWSRWAQGAINGTSDEAGDLFGSVLATGDFNNDGYDDLIIGMPSEDQGGLSDAGRVAVKYGNASGLLAANSSNSWSQASMAGNGNQADDHFGAAVAVGDFNGDTYDDVAVSAPDDDINGVAGSGRVVVIYGGAGGLSSGSSEAFNQNGVNATNEISDNFGQALAAGDFDNDGYDDLAIGVPYEDHSGVWEAGQIQIKYGDPAGLKAGGTEAFAAAALGAVARDYDFLGEHLAAGDLNGDGADDLVIGIPAKDVNGTANAGMVGVAFGQAGTGLVPVDDRRLFSDDAGPQAIAFGINFGRGVAVADLDNDGYEDIIAGAPNVSGQQGRIAVFFGNVSGTMAARTEWFSEGCMGGSASSNQYFGQILAAGDFDGDGDRELAAGDYNHDSGGVNQSGAVFVANIQ